MKNNLFYVLAMVAMLSACGEKTQKVQTMQKNDKVLSCDEILLEVNDAEFYKKQAAEKKALGIKSIVMPLGYVETFMSADEAIAAAESRSEYLNRIYEIRNCDAAQNDNRISNSLNGQLNNGNMGGQMNSGQMNGGAPIMINSKNQLPQGQYIYQPANGQRQF